MPNWEPLVEQLVEGVFGILDNQLPESLLQNLHQHVQDQYAIGNLRPAGIQQSGTLHTEIRRDQIQWIESNTEIPSEQSVLTLVNDLRTYLNRTCYTSLNSVEVQMAHYDTNSFYKPHRDQFHGCHDRQFTWILYLNPNWTETDGGQIKLYLPSQTVEIEPIWGRMLLFRSDIIHEVLPTQTKRISISGWLRRNSG